MLDYYNDNDAGAAAWLAELAAQGEIPDGRIDDRSILDVRPDDLAGFRRVHFFAGIGGWAEALRIANWPDEIACWTGSPPCQPFSVAGLGDGRDDPRHLAPQFARLVGAGRPLVLFGEQVASADVLGPISGPTRGSDRAAPPWAWSDDLQNRLEAAGYAYGATDLCSAGIGAPHLRQRLFFGAVRRDALPWIAGRLADHYGDGWGETGEGFGTAGHDGAFGDSPAGGVADGQRDGWRQERSNGSGVGTRDRSQGHAAGSAHGIDAGGVADGQRTGLQGLAGDGDRGGEPGRIDQIPNRPAAATGAAGGLDHAGGIGRQMGGGYHAQHDGIVAGAAGQGSAGPRNAGRGGAVSHQPDGRSELDPRQRRTGPLHGFWSLADWLFCRDERWRPVEPGTFPLADGIPHRVDLLRGFGNAINPWLAAAFIEAFARSIIDMRGINHAA